jgi:hypothetical protein
VKGMKYLAYSHAAVTPLALALGRWLYQGIVRFLVPRGSGPLLSRRRRRILIAAGVVLSLLLQVVLLWLLGEMISLCIALMEVWAELAAKHLEITLDRTSS